jgi:hypothetical protein
MTFCVGGCTHSIVYTAEQLLTSFSASTDDYAIQFHEIHLLMSQKLIPPPFVAFPSFSPRLSKYFYFISSSILCSILLVLSSLSLQNFLYLKRTSISAHIYFQISPLSPVSLFLYYSHFFIFLYPLFFYKSFSSSLLHIPRILAPPPPKKKYISLSP